MIIELDYLILFFILTSVVVADSCFTAGGSDTTVLDPTCAGGSVILAVEKDKPLVVNFKEEQRTGGQTQILNFLFGGCLVNATYQPVVSPPTFLINEKTLDLPTTFTVQSDKITAKGANKAVDVSCLAQIEPAGDDSGRSKIVVNYSATDPPHAKGFSVVYNAPIFVPKETEPWYESTWFMICYCVVGGVLALALLVGIVCLLYQCINLRQKRKAKELNVVAGQDAAPEVVSPHTPAGQNNTLGVQVVADKKTDGRALAKSVTAQDSFFKAPPNYYGRESYGGHSK
ncbi:hypothetical protein M3Y98_00891000 [Aphelenchoides besseyi]|nr:hypothetical protein M3Y98_00891000 [Aphelenchoides besseyi]